MVCGKKDNGVPATFRKKTRDNGNVNFIHYPEWKVNSSGLLVTINTPVMPQTNGWPMVT